MRALVICTLFVLHLFCVALFSQSPNSLGFDVDSFGSARLQNSSGRMYFFDQNGTPMTVSLG